jgi:hypothetical protein
VQPRGIREGRYLHAAGGRKVRDRPRTHGARKSSGLGIRDRTVVTMTPSRSQC